MGRDDYAEHVATILCRVFVSCVHEDGTVISNVKFVVQPTTRAGQRRG